MGYKQKRKGQLTLAFSVTDKLKRYTSTSIYICRHSKYNTII